VNGIVVAVGLSVICAWLPVTVALLVLRGDLDAPDVPKPMRAVGLICVMWLSWVTGPVIRAWQRLRPSGHGAGYVLVVGAMVLAPFYLYLFGVVCFYLYEVVSSFLLFTVTGGVILAMFLLYHWRSERRLRGGGA